MKDQRTQRALEQEATEQNTGRSRRVQTLSYCSHCGKDWLRKFINDC